MSRGSPCAAARRSGAVACLQCEVREISLCGELPENDLSELQSLVRHKEMQPGTPIFEEGDEARYVYNVSSGTIRLYKLLPNGRRQITGFLYPGDFLGLAARDIYSYGAEAVTELRLCQFGVRELEGLFERFPAMRARLFAIAKDELAAAQDQMLLLGRKTPIEKVSSFLLRRLKDARRFDPESDRIFLPMSRNDIADYLGLTIETVSRTFTRLKNDGVINLPDSHNVRIPDDEKLSELAEES
ncbi:cyclic nucleotide-binding domain-containing protein [Oceanibacterium hippocampi]|uniref:Transcriptional activatory protein AadR n=1 Tax=Oceanibacterium hippocampi TaxID=745714 RepID=A0A1Y5TBB5_9PROT|nr:cyclic nucleotide-binding domain-containing protein [Oceanibacterium hippocampi]SLN57977.1 Transcriptional activatory protein AadR [Oceanibacterium hippocampi]